MSRKNKQYYYEWDIEAADFDFNSLYPVSMQVASMNEFIGAEFAFARVSDKKTIVKLMHAEARDFVKQATGKAYTTIVLNEDDPLLSMIMLKFKGREEK